MKNLALLVGIAVLSMAFVGTVQAATVCGNPADSDSNTTYVTCGNGNPALLTGGWGTTNSEVPAVAQGQSVTDENGIHFTCQWSMGCVDVTHTAWYENSLAALHSMLGDAGFKHWVSLMVANTH